MVGRRVRKAVGKVGCLYFVIPFLGARLVGRTGFLGVFEEFGLFREVIESRDGSLVSWSSRTDDRDEKLLIWVDVGEVSRDVRRMRKIT